MHFEDKEEAKVRRSREKAAARASKSEAVHPSPASTTPETINHDPETMD